MNKLQSTNYEILKRFLMIKEWIFSLLRLMKAKIFIMRLTKLIIIIWDPKLLWIKGLIWIY